MALLVDTSALIAVERRGTPLMDALAHFAHMELWLSVITVSELLVGVNRTLDPRRKVVRASFSEELIARLPIIDVDLSVARTHAQLGAQLSLAGVAIGAHDLLIGATAIAHGASVLTENIRDFERIPGLTVFRPDW